MPQNDLLKRYLDAGMAFTAMTQARAEAIIRDLVRTGEVQADQARDAAAELFERSRRNTEALLETVRAEIRDQVENLGLASKAELDRLEQRLVMLTRGGRPAARSSAPKKAGAKKAAAKKAGAKKAGAKKAAAKKAGAKKAGAKKAGAKKAGARKAAAKKGATKRATKR